MTRARPHLDDAHVEAGLLRQLFADVARGLGCGGKGGLERLQLLGFDGGARAAPLRAGVLLLVLVVGCLLVRRRRVVRLLGVVLERVLEVRGQTAVRTGRHCGRTERKEDSGVSGGPRSLQSGSLPADPGPRRPRPPPSAPGSLPSLATAPPPAARRPPTPSRRGRAFGGTLP